MQAFWGIVLACMGLGEALTFAPDANKVAAAVKSIFSLLDTKEDEERASAKSTCFLR